MADLIPLDIGTGLVTGRFGVGIEDGPDPDNEPDLIPAVGFIDFEASIPYIPSPESLPSPLTILKVKVRGIIDDQGYLCVLTPGGTAGDRGVKLIAVDDPKIPVSNWHWNVSYRFTSVNGQVPKIDPHPLTVLMGEEIDLVKAARVPASVPIGVHEALAAALRSENASVEAVTISSEALLLAQGVVDRANSGEFKGVKGDPGGWVTGAQLGTQHLDTVLVDGPYRQDLSANATSALGYPTTSAGVLLVYQAVGSQTMFQKYMATYGASTGSRNIWLRTRNGGTWNPWRTYASTRVDNTAGLAIYQWDETAAREQRIYSDTGLRDITAELKNGWSVGERGFVRVQRIGDTVTYHIRNLIPTGATHAAFWTGIPDGFVAVAGTDTYRKQLVASATTVTICSTRRFDRDIQIPLNAGTIGDQYAESSVSFHYTSAPWPTSLPGTAVGTIPNT